MSRCTPDLARSAAAAAACGASKRRSTLRRLRSLRKKRRAPTARRSKLLRLRSLGRRRRSLVARGAKAATPVSPPETLSSAAAPDRSGDPKSSGKKHKKAPPLAGQAGEEETQEPRKRAVSSAAESEQRPAAAPDQSGDPKSSGKKRKRAPPLAGQAGEKDCAGTAARRGGEGGDAGVAALREQLQVRIEEDPLGDCPAPIASFQELAGLPDFVLRNLKTNGMTRPMPIQAQALPLVLAGRDVIGLAQTGSGKTLSFLLPVPMHMAKRPSKGQQGAHVSRVLILAPTRELAVQIAEEADKVFGASQGSESIRSVCVYGGGDKRPQQNKLRWGADIVVATPGRLLDFAESGTVDLAQVTYFVLDEADRMLDFGFQDDVTSIVGRVRKDRQVLFFSATWNTEVQKLAQGLCRSGSRPVRISYGQASDGGSAEQEAAKHRAREEIIQEVIVVDHPGDDHWERQDKEKRAILEKHLRTVLEESPDHKVLVFVSMKQFADEVSGQLQKSGFSADAMHGGKSQEYRLWVLDQFRKGNLRLLVCTDVLGRGIDIPSVSHVVVYEMGEVQDYVHRIGRTARGRHGKGHALVFFEYWEGAPNVAEELIDVLTASKQNVPDGLRKIADEVAKGKRKVRKTGWSK